MENSGHYFYVIFRFDHNEVLCIVRGNPDLRLPCSILSSHKIVLHKNKRASRNNNNNTNCKKALRKQQKHDAAN